MKKLLLILLCLPFIWFGHNDVLAKYNSGMGTLNYPNGDRYEGEWKDDTKNGQGTYIKADGKVYKRLWKNDRFKENNK